MVTGSPLSPPVHFKVVGFPASTAEGRVVKAIFAWARASETAAMRMLENCIVEAVVDLFVVLRLSGY